ncbi:hypothetical protein Acr_11g0006120 [Actinidia rufa]|uniref:Uncharacterized protein n=1 Tax=Actinidia rufa TaxID=165716 RepID=A0A7J0FCY9_9ERIC|nr:hypothetical protein Acr_11g0006120 [Actinidia rufa]
MGGEQKPQNVANFGNVSGGGGGGDDGGGREGLRRPAGQPSGLHSVRERDCQEADTAVLPGHPEGEECQAQVPVCFSSRRALTPPWASLSTPRWHSKCPPNATSTPKSPIALIQNPCTEKSIYSCGTHHTSLLNLSPDSPDAKIFKSGSSTSSTTDAQPTPVSASSGTSSSSSGTGSGSVSKATPTSNGVAKMSGSWLAMTGLTSLAWLLI